jgi:hypothetical protein
MLHAVKLVLTPLFLTNGQDVSLVVNVERKVAGIPGREGAPLQGQMGRQAGGRAGRQAGRLIVECKGPGMLGRKGPHCQRGNQYCQNVLLFNDTGSRAEALAALHTNRSALKQAICSKYGSAVACLVPQAEAGEGPEVGQQALPTAWLVHVCSSTGCR